VVTVAGCVVNVPAVDEDAANNTAFVGVKVATTEWFPAPIPVGISNVAWPAPSTATGVEFSGVVLPLSNHEIVPTGMVAGVVLFATVAVKLTSSLGRLPAGVTTSAIVVAAAGGFWTTYASGDDVDGALAAVSVGVKVAV
jgi:succinate-acetate transporter protein